MVFLSELPLSVTAHNKSIKNRIKVQLIPAASNFWTSSFTARCVMSSAIREPYQGMFCYIALL